MKRYLIVFLCSTSFLLSCSQTNKLSKKDYEWMPYRGDETLVFKSINGEIDTIFLLKKDTLLAYPEAQNSNGIRYEVVSIFSKHSDSNIENGKHRYLNNNFFKIEKAVDNRAELNISVLAKDAKFYKLSSIKIDSLSKVKPSIIQTQYSQYDDVYVIYAEDYLGNLHQRRNFITKVYWSKSNGLIRYDKKDSIYWELINKY